jgi:hypothetical protein
MERRTARGFATIVLACAGSAAPSPASACICVHERVTVVSAEGRVFILDGPSAAQAIPDAIVELQALGEHAKVLATTTDADGNFTLPTPPPGEYWLKVSLSGFPTTLVPVRIKKGRSRTGGRLVVRLEAPGADCACGDACVSKPDPSGSLEPKCLMKRRKTSLKRVGPPNNGLQLTRAARCAPSPSAGGQSLRAALAAEPGCSAGSRTITRDGTK